MKSTIGRVLSSVGWVLALGACSQALIIEKGLLAKAEQVECSRVARTGSHIVKRVCMTRSEREAQSQHAQSALAGAMEQQRAEQMARRATRPR